jgi:hypothetical protein
MLQAFHLFSAFAQVEGFRILKSHGNARYCL